MYEYEFVSVSFDVKFASLELEGHREEIAAWAAEGWRYNGWLPVQERGGTITAIELVFERQMR